MITNVSLLTNAASAVSWSNASRALDSSVAPMSRFILATSATAVVGWGLYRWSQSTDTPEGVPHDPIFERVKAKVLRAYSYVFGGFTLTAVAAAAAHISGLSLAILRNSYLQIPITLGVFGSLFATIWTDKDDVKLKHIAWVAFNATMGLMLSPLGFISQKIVDQAAAISLGLGGILTFIAYQAPDRRFLKWEAPLLTALSSISIASAIATFFPKSAFAYGVDRVSLYGGLAIFSGLLMSSTQRLVTEAEQQNERTFDPINSSLNIYLDGLNIFIRILRILLENKDNSKKA